MRAIALIRRPADLCAVRAAAAIGETTAIALVPDRGEHQELLARARAASAKRLVRVWDDALETTDYLGTAIALAQAILAVAGGELAREGIVVVCGETGRGAIGPAVAERLAVPHLGGVVGTSRAEGRLVIKRRTSGVVRLYTGAPPLLLCVAADESAALEPAAQPEPAAQAEPEIESWGLDRLELTSAGLSYRRRFRPHPNAGPVARAHPFADAGALASRLREDGLL